MMSVTYLQRSKRLTIPALDEVRNLPVTHPKRWAILALNEVRNSPVRPKRLATPALLTYLQEQVEGAL